MSRPPRPHFIVSTTGDQPGRLDAVDYLPSELGDFVALQHDLAAAELGRATTQEEGDFANTLMELSALVGHILGVYQDRYAGEAWISTATATSSLVRHARRLAYVPDSGLAATGHVVLLAKDGLSGDVASGLGLGSVPRGEEKAQDYETLDDLFVDHRLNEMLPARATKARRIRSDDKTLVLDEVGHGIEVNDVIALVGQHTWRAFTVTHVAEDEGTSTTALALDRKVGKKFVVPDPVSASPSDVMRVLAHPRATLRSFGWSADPSLYPAQAFKNATDTEPAPSTDGHWYEVAIDGRVKQYSGADVYLATAVDVPLRDRFLVRRGGGLLPEVYRVGAEATATVVFHRREIQSFQTFNVEISENGGGYKTSLAPKDAEISVQSHLSGTVTAIHVQDFGGATVGRAMHPVPSTWLTDWAIEARLKADEPNRAPVQGTAAAPATLELTGRISSLVPGRPLLFTSLAEDRSQLVLITSVVLPEADGPGAVTEIQWEALTPAPSGGWHLHDLKVFGNVARVSHGRTVTKVLGGSDGVTPFLRFELKQSPVTILPSADGGEPAITVRVNDVVWSRVTDFWDSGPDDRQYRVEIDEEQVATVVFGDGRNGAIPPAGDRNISVTHRVGSGASGNLGAGRLSRIKKAHPLLDGAFNFMTIGGGTEPANPEDVRVQATRYIRTFDRAVSVSDHADLALLYPGVARATARWNAERGEVELVVATAEGKAPQAMAELRAFVEERRDTNVPLVLHGPTSRAVYVSVVVAADPAHLPEVVKGNVRAALIGGDEEAPGLFTFLARDLGQPAFLSELYQVIDGARGVVSCRVTRFAARPSSSVADVVIVDANEWLYLDPKDLVVSIQPEVS